MQYLEGLDDDVRAVLVLFLGCCLPGLMLWLFAAS